MNKTSAGIVSYNPDIDLLIKNISSVEKQVDTVFVFDNGSKNQTLIEKKICGRFNNVIFLKSSKNIGVGAALNQLAKEALKNKYDSLLTLDQDTICPPNMVFEFVKEWKEEVGLMGPDVRYNNNNSYFTEKQGTENAEWLITSGSLLNLAAFTTVGGFDEKLFIDDVDRDYCLRVRQAGYSIIKNNNVFIQHSLGDLKCKKLFGRVVYVTNHCPERYYYMARNSIYLDYKLNINYSKKYVKHLKTKILLFEKNKFKKIRWINRGKKDAKKMILGNIVSGPFEE